VDRILLISSRSEWGSKSHLILRADVVIGPYITLGKIYIYFLENIVFFIEMTESIWYHIFMI